MSLFDSARNYLSGRFRPDQPTATDAVEFDAFDKIVWNEMLRDAPALTRLGDDLTAEHGYGEDMVRDTFMSLFKYQPRMRGREEMKRTHVPNHAGMGAVFSSTELDEARQVCEMDEYGAAMATTSIARAVATEVAKYRAKIEEAEEQAQSAEEQAQQADEEVEQALQEAEQAQQEAEQAQEGADEATEEADGEAQQAGGPVPSQCGAHAAQQAAQAAGQAAAAAQQALANALAKAQAKAQAAAQAEEAAEKEAERAQGIMQKAVDEAIDEAIDERREENEQLAAYGLGAGERKKLSFEQRAAYAQMIQGSKFRELSKLFGGMRMMFKAAARERTVIGKDHIVGITTGGLEDMIEDEFTNLVHPALKMQLLQRITTEQALNFDYQGKEQVGDGAIIIAIDNSGSMGMAMGMSGYSHSAPCPEPGCRGRITYNYGSGMHCDRCRKAPHTREAYAKALALALVQTAKASGRDVVCINFSSPTYGHPMTEYRFPKGKGDLKDLIEFVEEFQNGGTEFEPPIERAMEIIKADFTKDGLARADVVFITDDDCRVNRQWVERVVDPVKREIGCKVWGIAIGEDVKDAGPMSLFCDDVRAIKDLYDTSLVADLAKGIQ